MSTTRLPELPSMPEPAATLHAPDGDNITLHAPRQLRDYAHAYGLAVWKAAMEAAAKAVNAKFLQPMTKQHAEAVHNIAIRECLDAIRSLPLPEQGGPQERRE